MKKTPNINAVLALPSNKGYSIRGADMGRRSQRQGSPERLHLQRMRFVDGAYDTGGAYWGCGNPIYCAFSPATTENDEPVRVFVRAKDRAEAKTLVLEELNEEGFTFYR